MNHFMENIMHIRHQSLAILAGMILLASAPLHAQAVNDSQIRPSSEEKQDIGQRPNRNGIFEGINIMDNTVMISGKGYKALDNPSRIPTLANGNSMPLMMVPEGSRIEFNVDGEGRVTAVWINGDLTQ
jgi:hypothetical protein